MASCRIRVLEEEVANKIAAGEVVERPASVVKELLENAVDAGATRITVEVQDGGKACIRIADNGCGMTAQEAVLALQRHATSKISRAEDLAAVRTLGFRGEALPSVASVSRVSLVTRARGELEGVRLEAEGGEIHTLEPAGAAEGTVITVTDLFYNTPARLKFLKTTRTELGQVCDAVSRLALSHPEISVRLTADGDELIHAPGSTDPRNTVTALYGKELARDLLPVSAGRPSISVEGYASRPTLTRPTRSGQHLFVNGRWIRSRTLTHALDEAYRSTVHAGRFPFAVLHVDIDPALVDVNVHPAKTEVRFLRDWEVHRAVVEAVRLALGTIQEGISGALPGESLARQETLRADQLQGGPWLPPAPGSPLQPADPFDEPDAGSIPGPGAGGGTPRAEQAVLPEMEAPPLALRPVAQLWNSYILAEGPTGLLVIDQHLAHERVLFDRFQASGRAEDPGAQRLVAPLTLQLTHRDAVSLQGLLPELGRLGFDLEAFGRDAYVVRSAPHYVRPGSELAVLRGILDELSENGRGGASPHEGPVVPRLQASDRMAATAACKAAVKKGSRLAPEEVRQLLDDLSRAEDPHTCPHGCPITIEISYQELLKRFKRI